MSKILFNGLHYSKEGAGISRYTNKIINEFCENKYDIDILMRNEFKNNIEYNGCMFIKEDIYSSKDRIIYEQLKAKKLYKNYDLIHFPDYATPVLYRGKKIATIHDMAMYTMRDKYTRSQIMTKDLLLKNTINHADRLICVSEFSRRELIKYFPNAEEKAEVVYSGIDIPEINLESKFEKVTLDKFKIESNNYILYVGTIAPQKNIDNLIKGFVEAKKQGLKCKIVIAGRKGWGYEDIIQYISQSKIEDEVIFTDYISDLELEVLYKNAKIFTSISLYEGFGFPPLEALGRGVPVLLSDIDIFKEICGESALYCNPKDINDIAFNIVKLCSNKMLQNELRKKGLNRIKLFDWSLTAEKLYKSYLDILR